MHALARTVRFSVSPVPGERAGSNGFAGTPSPRGLARWYELVVTCRGEPNPATGYLINITEIDSAVRGSAAPLIERTCADQPEADPLALMPEIIRALSARLAPMLARVRWNVTPTYALEQEVDDMSHATIRQQFDFSASHRLHVPSLSEEENRRLFSKCNNPNGHGHNYRVEPEVRVRLSDRGAAFSLEALERITKRTIIDRFDHTHLNLDTAEFAPDTGLNPSVENIAQVCHRLLAEAIALEAPNEASLQRITVWETDRTSATYPA